VYIVTIIHPRGCENKHKDRAVRRGVRRTIRVTDRGQANFAEYEF
jgi:hypothetical protein